MVRLCGMISSDSDFSKSFPEILCKIKFCSIFLDSLMYHRHESVHVCDHFKLFEVNYFILFEFRPKLI